MNETREGALEATRYLESIFSLDPNYKREKSTFTVDNPGSLHPN